MKKTTKLQTVPVENEPVKPKRGPTKEKTQITIRLDKQLLDEAYAQMKKDDTRITDIIERGIFLALAERNHEMSAYTKQVRFVLANATRDQQVLLRGLAIAMVEMTYLREYLKVMAGKPGVKKAHKFEVFISHSYNDLRTINYDQMCSFLESRNKLPHADDCLRLYGRYGKTAEEVKKLGSLQVS